MKFMKYLVVLVVACLATAISSQAQTVQFAATGSSALFLELGQSAATQAATNTPCVWSAAKVNGTTLGVNDSRPGAPGTVENGQVWVTWSAGTGTCAAPAGAFNMYMYVQTDSVIGDRCFFATPQCTIILATSFVGTADAGLLGAGVGTPTNLPSAVQVQLGGAAGSQTSGHVVTAAGTDVRPEDAKFASKRMFTSCGSALTRQPAPTSPASNYATAGLGYQGTKAGIGTQVKSSFSTSLFNVLDFNLTGTDPITGKAILFPLSSDQVFALGAQPMIIAVSGVTAGSGILKATDINRATLAQFQDGTLGRSGDITQSTDANAVMTILREPLSGTYNTMEYGVPNTLANHTSQEAGNCSGIVPKTNPMNLPSANGKVVGASRQRVIGTSEAVKALAGTVTTTTTAQTCGLNVECLGYFFWGTGNEKPLVGDTHAKYLTVDGVDPILTSYSTLNGAFPSSAQFSDVTFANLAAGDYAIWSVLRLVAAKGNAGATNMQTAVASHSSTVPDLIKIANLKILKSHFTISSIGINAAANGDGTCGTEAGGDVGSLTLNIKADSDFCSDFGSTTGKINFNQ